MQSRGKLRRNALAVALIIASAMLSSLSIAATTGDNDWTQTRTYQLNLPEQTVATALTSLSEQTDIQVLFPYDIASKHRTQPIVGSYKLQNVLDLLLQDTGLYGGLTQSGVITISLNGTNQNGKGKSMNSNKRKNLLATMIGLFAASGVAQQAYGQGVDSATAQSQINEVFVTADKREAKSVQDLAAAISAIGGEEIDKKNLVSMDDYLRNIPGVSFQDRGAGQNSIVIRGMATNPQGDAGGSTAGAYFGETPIANMRGPSNTGTGGNADVKLVDIERVEVLRGPQGTLYGAGSMAGTVRIIPNAPKLDRVEGSIAARLSNTDDAGGDNNSVQAAINIPLIEDKFALRGVAYRMDNSGFIDNVAASQPNSRITDAVILDGAVAEDKGDRGGDTYTGFRLAALWQITEQFDATLSYLTQDIEQDGLPEVNLLADGDFQQQRLKIGRDQQGDESLESELDVVSLVLNYDLGWGTISSASSWLDNDIFTGQDISALFSLFADNAYFLDNSSATELFVEELRLSSQLDGPLQFVAGLYYEDRDEERDLLGQWSGDQSSDPFPPSGLPASRILTDNHLEQKSVFGELSYDLSEQWAVTVGARHFDYKVENNESNVFLAGQFNGGLPSITETTIEETGQIYKGVLSYTPSEDVLVYGQWAQGFRVGAGQSDSPTCAAVGVEFPDVESDTSESLELGVKSSWLDNRITFNAAVYRTDWDDIPVVVNRSSDPVCNPTENAGKAVSEGVEIELRALLTENLQLDLSASTVDATLEETSNIGNKGDDLPGSADYNATISLEYGFALASHPSFARLEYAYVGEYYNNVAATGTPAGDFEQVHFKLGTEVGQVNIDLFVNNLTNEDGFTWVETTLGQFTDSQRGYVIRPRTMGINVGYHF